MAWFDEFSAAFFGKYGDNLHQRPPFQIVQDSSPCSPWFTPTFGRLFVARVDFYSVQSRKDRDAFDVSLLAGKVTRALLLRFFAGLSPGKMTS